jgi:hypothetical protein
MIIEAGRSFGPERAGELVVRSFANDVRRDTIGIRTRSAIAG